MQQTVEDFCKRIHELDTSGGFTSFLFKPKHEVMFSAPQQRMTAVSVRTKWTQRGGAQYNLSPPRGSPKRARVCYYCGKAGHCARECRLKWAHDITQINHRQAPLYNSGSADQYQVYWINKRDEKN